MKALYTAPETWIVPVTLESVLCESGTGEDMNPWNAPSPIDVPDLAIF